MPKGTAILNYNFKGGVGKTTITALESYQLAKYKKRVLVVDFDPQANLTNMLERTYNLKFKPTIDFKEGLLSGNLTNSICKCNKYLDILPANWNLVEWSSAVDRLGAPKKYCVLRELLKPLKSKYDYILLDVPPTFASFSLNAIFAADDIDIVLETQVSSYLSALKTASALSDLYHGYNLHFNFLGVILYLMISAKVDRQVARKAMNFFHGAIFAHRIHRQERVKGFSMNGISDKDGWDKRAIRMYKKLTDETVERIEEMSKYEE